MPHLALKCLVYNMLNYWVPMESNNHSTGCNGSWRITKTLKQTWTSTIFTVRYELYQTLILFWLFSDRVEKVTPRHGTISSSTAKKLVLYIRKVLSHQSHYIVIMYLIKLRNCTWSTIIIPTSGMSIPYVNQQCAHAHNMDMWTFKEEKVHKPFQTQQ